MPRPVLTWVAAVIGALSLGSFVLGVATAPSRGRLPGEPASGKSAAPLQAIDATPLGDERIEGASPPPELSDEEKAKLAEEKEAKAEAAAAAKALAAQENQAIASPAPITPPPVTAPTPTPQPKPEEPVF